MAENEKNENVGEDGGDILDRMSAALDRLEELEAGQAEVIQREVQAAFERLASETSTPTKTTERIVVRDRFDQMGWTRGDVELAVMLFDGARQMKRPVNIATPEDLLARYRAEVFESGAPLPYHVDPETGKPLRDAQGNIRAMDTTESGFGQQLVGQQYVSDLWAAARNEDSLVADVRQIPMTAPTTFVPIDGGLPELLFVGESTADAAPAYAVSDTASNRRQLDAKKFTIQQIWSGELSEDSIIAFVPFLREKLAQSVAAHVGSAYYNGDTTNAATGNINLDDADPPDTKHYLAWDGIRHTWLVDAVGQGFNMAGALNPDEIWKARGRLSGQGNSVNTAVRTINWGVRPRELRLVCDWDTFMTLHRLGEVLTVDKYGPQATVLTGELGSFGGIPIVSPAYASKTEADGKASVTEANNTKGQLTVFNPRGVLAGVRRDTQLFFDRIQRTDQFLLELYLRLAFVRFDNFYAAGIYNITV